jgi:endogenous inhibitor of DNA gyrase (YacG/DUF329 family)
MLETPSILGYATQRENPSSAADQQERRVDSVSKLVTVQCGHCEKSVVRKPSAIRSSVVYCSHKCRAAVQFSDTARQVSAARMSRKRALTTCEWCGEGFAVRKSVPRKFCSRACYGASTSDSASQSRECMGCGVTFEAKTRDFVKLGRRFCGRSCWATWRITGERNPRWGGGISSARDRIKATEEYRQWRISVFRRDRFRCVACLGESTQNNPIEAHHIKPFALFPELAVIAENGCTLCQKCHKKTYGAEMILADTLKTRILRDLMSDTGPIDLAKVKSDLNGDIQRPAETTGPLA